MSLPAFDPNAAAATAAAAAFAESTPPLYPSTIAPTTSTQAANPFHLSTPKPDISIGLTHAEFTEHQQIILIQYQASGLILSDPHAADMGIRFPFLIVEAKGLSQNGTLVSAQNQAAVGAASALAILQDLKKQTDGDSDLVADSGEETPTLCFSIVTEGPVHELNVHFFDEGAFHMHCFRACRTTLQRDTIEFVYMICRLLEWGRGNYRSAITRQVDLLV